MIAAAHAVASPWGLLCLAAYALLVVLVLGANHVGHRKATAAAEVVHWLPVLPPVPAPVTPPFSQAIPDASWFDGMPVEILSTEAVRSLFDRLVDLDDNLRDLA